MHGPAVGAALYGSLHAVGVAENIPTSQSVPRQPVANLDPDNRISIACRSCR